MDMVGSFHGIFDGFNVISGLCLDFFVTFDTYLLHILVSLFMYTGMWRVGGPLLKTAVSPSHCQAPAMTLFTRPLSTGPSLMARILTSNISAVRQG